MQNEVSKLLTVVTAHKISRSSARINKVFNRDTEAMATQHKDPDDYQYDFFLSYKTESFMESGYNWVEGTFLPTLRATFSRECGVIPRIHDYPKEIKYGGEWPRELKRKLAYSRCLLPLWCAGYFRSEWCLYELEVMRRRELTLGMRSDENSKRLILPILVADGDDFPEYTRSIEHLDIRKLMYGTPAFKESPRFMEFEDNIRKWVSQAIDAIVQTPTWDPKWLSEEDPALPKVNPRKNWSPLM